MSLPVMELPGPDESPSMGAPVSVIGAAEPYSPMWWLRRLLAALEHRRARIERFDSYYRGYHPLNFFDRDFQTAFGNRWSRFASNFTSLVVDRFADRLEVQGFRFRDGQGDDDLWEIWQANDLDGGAAQAHTEALIKEVSYALVEPRRDELPVITVEDAIDCIVALDPRDHRRRLAGLKRWQDDAGHLVAYLYLPDEVRTYRTRSRIPDGWADWLRPESPWPTANALEPWATEEQDAVIPNPLGVVPLVPIANRPRLRGDGRSEIDPITSNQDAVNYFRAMAVVGARFLAYPQRWIKNFVPDINPDTGLMKMPFKAGMQQIWTFEPSEDQLNPLQIEVGQFAAADMTPFLKLMEAEVRSMAVIAGLPYELLLGQASLLPESGEAKKSGEASLVKKLGRMQTSFGEGWEETMRVALLAMDDKRATIRTAETKWLNPETRNEAVRTDSVVKQIQSDIIDNELALEQLGYTVEQIRRLEKRRKAAEAEAAKEEAAAAKEPETAAVVGAVPAFAVPSPRLSISSAPTGPRMSPTEG